MNARLRDSRPPASQAPAAAGAMRRIMFLSQDGVVLCTTLRALDDLGLLEPSLRDERSLLALYPGITQPGFGALRVAARCLAGVGWLAEDATLDPETTTLRWTRAGRNAMGHRALYVALGEFLASFSSAADDAWTRVWTPNQLERFHDLTRLASDRWGIDDLPPDEQGLITAHLDGGVIVPTMLWLHQSDRLSGPGPSLPESDAGAAMAGLLAPLGWVDPSGNWTASGEQARGFALNFGGVATYMPLLARLPELYRGELTVSAEADGDAEWHVHRGLNLSISSVAHKRYFGDTDEVFLELFDREPVRAQPRFIADMGCGEGAWLIHLHGLVKERTLRGRRLDEHPLLMIGIDPSPTAMQRAREALQTSGVPGIVLPGDVTDPDGLRSALAEHGLAIEDGLHIRAFIDHERTYRGGDGRIEVPGWSSGAYLDVEGASLSGRELERDLVAHLRRWAPHVPKHGLVVLEAHCVAPQVTRRHLGAQHSVALDAHQAYSKQYPVDHPAWIRCCREAGLQAVGHSEQRYPSSRPFVAVSVNRMLAPGAETPLPGTDPVAPREDTWQPGPDTDLEDGRALHEILFAGGDIRYPAMWCSAPTGFVVAGALEAIEARLEDGGQGETIRILDYGAGTGTATIELLKACHERDLEARLGHLGSKLEVHLVDLPSSWFAQGFELLRDCTWTHFHSLHSPGGGFRPLLEVTGGLTMDAVMANMVFHLIPPRALGRAGEELATVTNPGGRLLWSSPDLGPPGPYAVLLHEPNRALRKRWLALLHDDASDGDATTRAGEMARRVRASLDQNALRAAQDRADRRILPHPMAADVAAALGAHFQGEAETRTYEMLAEEIVSGLLVPSNQAEYLPEIDERAARGEVIRELMLEEVIPALQDGPAGTALGLNLHWTLGAFTKR